MCDTIHNWAQVMPEPQAPKNYKDAQKIAEYIEKRREEQMVDAPGTTLTGRIFHVCIVGDSGEEFLNEEGPRAGLRMLEFIEKRRASAALESELLIVSGVAIHDLVHIAALGAIDANGTLPDELQWSTPRLDAALRLAGDGPRTIPAIVDPVDVIFNTSTVDPTNALVRLGRQDLISELRTAEGRANIANVLSAMLGLTEDI